MKYSRDERSGAVLLCGTEEVNDFLSKKSQQDRIDDLQRQINSLQEKILEVQQHITRNNTDNTQSE